MPWCWPNRERPPQRIILSCYIVLFLHRTAHYEYLVCQGSHGREIMKKVIVALITAGFFLTANGQARADSLVGISFGPQAGPTDWTTETDLTSGAATDLITENGSGSGIDLS